MDKTKAPAICIDCSTTWVSTQTIGELIKHIDPSTLEDLLITIADEIADENPLDFHDRCIVFADCCAVGKVIVDRIRELPSEWDGTSWLTLSPAEKDTVSVDQTGNTNALPLAEIACARLRTVSECDAEYMIRMVLKALIAST